MSTTQEKTLRDKYFSNEIFRIGDLVEDTKTGEEMKILDRGSNYVTVATKKGIVKKWLNEVKEETPKRSEMVTEEVVIPSEFEILESGQIKLFGYETKNFDSSTSECLLEQFTEFDDLYSKHQIIKLLDSALMEDTDKAYEYCQKVESFYSKQDKQVPFILEVLKNDLERTRITQVLAKIAGSTVYSNDNNKTIKVAIDSLKSKYKSRVQWEVLFPLFRMIKDTGLPTVMSNLPFIVNEDTEEDIILEALLDNIDLLVEDLDLDDINETFEEIEFSEDELVNEVLSITARNRLSRKIKQHEPMLTVKRDRAMNRSATSDVLMTRARRLAETMVKQRIFHKAASDMSRQEKERFESGAGKRKALIARLAQRLMVKVRGLQTARLHHTP